MNTKTYYNFLVMLKDMDAHAKSFPDHKFLTADSGGKIVYVAYDPNDPENDFRGQWEISIRDIWSMDIPKPLIQVFMMSEARRGLCERMGRLFDGV